MSQSVEVQAGRGTWAHWSEPRSVQVGNIEVAVRSQGSGPALLFLHGAGITRVWLPFCEELSKHFTVYAPEHPGFGDSPRSQELKSIEDYALFYDAFLRSEVQEPVHLVGHSLGGWIAASMATIYPSRFASVTLLAPAGMPGTPGSGTDVFRMDEETAGAALFNGRAENYLHLLAQEGETEDFIRSYEEDITLAQLTWHPRFDVNMQRRLQRVQSPVLVVEAERDRLLPSGSARGYAQGIAGARHEVFHGLEQLAPSGHLLHIEEPGRVAALVTQFAQRHSSAEKGS